MASQFTQDPVGLRMGGFETVYRQLAWLPGGGSACSKKLYLHRTTEHKKTRTNIRASIEIRILDPSSKRSVWSPNHILRYKNKVTSSPHPCNRLSAHPPPWHWLQTWCICEQNVCSFSNITSGRNHLPPLVKKLAMRIVTGEYQIRHDTERLTNILDVRVFVTGRRSGADSADTWGAEHDVAKTHTAITTNALLQEFFTESTAGRGLWPPRSPDNPESLQNTTELTVADTDPETLKGVAACLRVGGKHLLQKP
jgi:hypothetical protein